MKRKRKAKRGGGDLTGSAQNRIVCKDEWASGHLLGDSNKDMWTGLSDELKLYLSRSVASITLCDALLDIPTKSQQKKTGLAESKVLKVCRSGSRPFGEKSNSHPKVHGDFLNQEQLDLESLGYPKLPSNVSGDGMILVNTFEETFGDMHGEGVWTKFGEKACNLNDNVVALASFND
nr:unnamed protein product [Digitaria exilis]